MQLIETCFKEKILNLCKKIEQHRKFNFILPCWGYEADSNRNCLLHTSKCSGPIGTWASGRNEQLEIFFNQADFGYVQERRTELEHYCSPNGTTSSELTCTNYMRYCTGKNILIDLKQLGNIPEPIRYREDILQYGDIGGWNCTLNREKLLKQGDHKSPLMSWYAEMANFRELSNKHVCDTIIEKPAIIMKLDATINMYHHFCDFLNLYLSFHLNGTNFNRDNQIIIWDSYPYRSNFKSIWEAFTSNPILSLNDLGRKRICFKDVMFPLLPRMIFGMYYNMPLIPGCERSGVFRSFNRHLLLHLNISSTTEHLRNDPTMRITFIRRRTKYRQVLNEDKLIFAMKNELLNMNNLKFEIKSVDLNHQMPFLEQIAITSKTDILIGMHGAGLTHTLFQPDYGLLFELYNCKDVDCYRDLARLRGTHYLTWRNDSKLSFVEVDNEPNEDRKKFGSSHAKFVNYRFDEKEFIQLILEAIEIINP
ncbi:hypothetical protein BLOT_001072 [Blomia tropicalis]|nr:hypothetical protein BLOT_001072 [Blomia tropicalis]